MSKISINGSLPKGLSQDDIILLVTNALVTLKQANAEAEINFISNNLIRKLNKEFRGIDKPTDVLSFPQAMIPKSHFIGSMEICDEIVKEKNEEISSVIKHGLLHLLHFDHETDAKAWQTAANSINCKL